jgi:hypothetical protein
MQSPAKLHSPARYLNELSMIYSVGVKVMPTDFFSQVRAELFKKTGESGTWCLGLGLGAYIISQEYLILHEEVCYAVCPINPRPPPQSLRCSNIAFGGIKVRSHLRFLLRFSLFDGCERAD